MTVPDVDQAPDAFVPVTFVDRNGLRQLVAVLGWFQPSSGGEPPRRAVDRDLTALRTEATSGPRDRLLIEFGGFNSVWRRKGYRQEHLALEMFEGIRKLRPGIQLVLVLTEKHDTSPSRVVRRELMQWLLTDTALENSRFRLDKFGKLVYNPTVSLLASQLFQSSTPGTMTAVELSAAQQALVRFDGGHESIVNETNNVAEPLSRAELELYAEAITEGIHAHVSAIADPMGRILLLDMLTKDPGIYPALYEQMMDAASEFRQAGGTWREIGEGLGVSPQAVQQRLDPEARKRRNTNS